MPGGAMPKATHRTLRSRGASVPTTILMMQEVGTTKYFDVAGYAGRTVRLDETKL